MAIFSGEILGRVPNGLTHNDVFATVKSMVEEYSGGIESISKRRLAGNMVSITVRFAAVNENQAKHILNLAYHSVFNFSADVIGPREVK